MLLGKVTGSRKQEDDLAKTGAGVGVAGTFAAIASKGSAAATFVAKASAATACPPLLLGLIVGTAVGEEISSNIGPELTLVGELDIILSSY